MNRKSLLINFMFIFAVAISLIAINRFLKLSSLNKVINENETPDSYIVNASYRRTNEQGENEIALFSPIIKHYRVNDRSEFKKPRIEIDKNDQHWLITSNSGQGFNGTKKFYLNDNVVVRQSSCKSKGEAILLTKQLTVYPKQELVTTKEHVIIKQPGLNVSGVGLRGNLKDGNIQLLSQTRGEYDRKKLP